MVGSHILYLFLVCLKCLTSYLLPNLVSPTCLRTLKTTELDRAIIPSPISSKCVNLTHLFLLVSCYMFQIELIKNQCNLSSLIWYCNTACVATKNISNIKKTWDGEVCFVLICFLEVWNKYTYFMFK